MLKTSLEDLRDLVERHSHWRSRCLNLCAAENALSPAVLGFLSGSFVQRYADYAGRDLKNRKYLGTRHIVALEEYVNALAAEVFGASEVELRPLSGHVAGNAVIMGLCNPGDCVFELDRNSGGHRLAAKLATAPLISLQVQALPFDCHHYNLDIQAVLEMVARLRPRLVIVGSSNFLFPYDLEALSEGLRAFPDTVLVYDASHVLGLIAGGRFQKPLEEGSDLVLAGTQKSFPGPQGGLIYSNNPELMEAVSATLYPALISNHHPARIPALGMALLEMKAHGAGFAAKVIENSQALGACLEAEGLQVVGSHLNYSQSHTVLLQLPDGFSAAATAGRLDDLGIVTNAIPLPWSKAGGLRLGTAEVTRMGASRADMADIASILADAILNRKPGPAIGKRASEFSTSLPGINPN
ncbi:MAG: hypothetical protein JJU20_10660 [Opitutales bacterium]|nr:hypothetical protein [Opitutales bacterium]